jgi:hypothetical protein
LPAVSWFDNLLQLFTDFLSGRLVFDHTGFMSRIVVELVVLGMLQLSSVKMYF